MFDNIKLSHNQSIDWLFDCKERVSKISLTTTFLGSLSSNKIELRCGLPAFALASQMPKHQYSQQQDRITYCPVCGDMLFCDTQEIDLSFYNKCRFDSGCGMIGDENFDVSYLAFCLEQHLRIPTIEPTNNDINIFKNIIEIVAESSHDDTPNELEKRLAQKKLFKSNHWQRRYLLESLSFCGIIENPREKGYFHYFAPPKNRFKDNYLSEWNYPIRLWRGENGVNKAALEYWFGEFL